MYISTYRQIILSSHWSIQNSNIHSDSDCQATGKALYRNDLHNHKYIKFLIDGVMIAKVIIKPVQLNYPPFTSPEGNPGTDLAKV